MAHDAARRPPDGEPRPPSGRGAYPDLLRKTEARYAGHGVALRRVAAAPVDFSHKL
jgi:hypothetical protein